MLTTFDLGGCVYEAFELARAAFVLNDAPAGQLLTAIRVVAEGEALRRQSPTG